MGVGRCSPPSQAGALEAPCLAALATMVLASSAWRALFLIAVNIALAGDAPAAAGAPALGELFGPTLLPFACPQCFSRLSVLSGSGSATQADKRRRCPSVEWACDFGLHEQHLYIAVAHRFAFC